jgi:acrylyl-CoA reductase (NADPH)
VDSVMCPTPQRLEAWKRIASLLDNEILDLILERIISLAEIPEASRRILNGEVRGRIVVALTR